MTSHGGRVPTKWLQTLRRRNVSLLQRNVYHASLTIKLVNSDMDTIDEHLSFDVHVEELCKKLSQRIADFRKIRRFIPIEQRHSWPEIRDSMAAKHAHEYGIWS